MNASIQGIIDHMFRDTVDNAETRALHEELLNNCQEHYEDLISRGMSETESIDAVVDSLKGMKEVIDEYPKKAGREEPRKEEPKDADNAGGAGTEVADKEIPQEEKPSEYVYDPASVRKLRADFGNSDLIIGASHDGRIHVRCEDMDLLLCSLDGTTLYVRNQDRTRKALEDAGRQMRNQEFSVKGLLSFIGKTIGSVASTMAVSKKINIDLPDPLPEEMDLSTKSGDIDVKTALPKILTAHCMNGDVTVKASDIGPASKITISCVSGDILAEGNADSIQCSSMSGDAEARGVYRIAELKSTSGDVQLNGEAEEIRMNSVSGDVKVEIRGTTARSIQSRTVSGDVEIHLASGTDSVHTCTGTTSGTVRCSIPDSGSGARIQITASSVSGDLTIC